ncbi:MAG: serine/threonine-protein phosphatase [Bacteroidales bacterium]|nr:serine/threonine-protein phosphatase [Bacteroidales bacterium]MBO7566407.1 serine/threonine-protein phosphatase [Bacteroidales bacterium]
MSDGKALNKLRSFNFKLKMLLEVTNNIITNMPVEQLIDRFHTMLAKDLKINKVLIYIFQENSWKIILKYGVTPEDYDRIVPERDFESIKDITVVYSGTDPKFSAFDFVIPLYNDDKIIAYMLMDDFDAEDDGMSPSIRNLQFFQTLTNFIIVSIQNHRLVEENMKQERFKKEMEMAAEMQKMLIPKSDIFKGDNRIYVEPFYMPHFQVGGDYYDFDYLSKDEMFFCIADVSGKGMAAAILMSNFQASLKALFVPDMDLPTLVSRLNSIVVKNSNGDRFITFFIGRYNFKTNELRYVNAGHNSPLLYNRKTRELSYLDTGCVGVGMVDEIVSLKEGVIKLDNDYKLLCFTDGVVELESDDDPDFGQKVVKNCVGEDTDIKTTISSIIKSLDIQRSNTKLFDDITLLGIDFYVNTTK